MKNSRNEKEKKMGRKSRLDSIEAKIEKAQQRVSITCEMDPFPAIGIGLKNF